MAADRSRNWNTQGGWAVGLVAVLVLAAVIAAVFLALRWFGDDEEIIVTVPQLLETPGEYYDEDNLQISGSVNRVLSPNVYTMGGPDFQDVEILVVGPPPPIAVGRTEEEALFQGDIVQVSGELREFDRQALEEEIDGELPEGVEDEFASEPVFIADSAVLWPRFPVEQGVPTSIQAILAEPDAVEDGHVTIAGEVTETLGENIFLVTDEVGGEIVVVDATGGVGPEVAQEAVLIQVTGPVVTFDLATIEEHTDVEIEPEAAEQVDGRVTIIGELIQILPDDGVIT
jgi:uncharacterized protein YdeI (BOF family)